MFSRVAWLRNLILGFSLLLSSCSTFYLGRYIAWNVPEIDDYKRFPSREIANAGPIFRFKESELKKERFLRLFGTVEYKRAGEKTAGDLELLLEDTGTTAFIVIQNDYVIYERYFNGYTRDSINTAFSVSKSFISGLVGIAIAESHFGSLEDPITAYVPELKDDRFGSITLKHLLSMSSGLQFSNSLLPWGDRVLSYYSTDLRSVVYDVRIAMEAGRYFNYNDNNFQLLGMVLERTTGRSVSEYLQEKIWKPLGMEFPASWSLDSEQSGFELMPAGLNARAVDFAKYGRLFLNEGLWDGRWVIPSAWVHDSTVIIPKTETILDYYHKVGGPQQQRDFFNADSGYYSLGWWGYPRVDGNYDFYGQGALGQFLYISPRKKVIIVRHGTGWGGVYWWPSIFRRMVDRL